MSDRHHALFVPYPVQGQIIPMLHLARALTSRHPHTLVTFLNNRHNHRLLLSKLRIPNSHRPGDEGGGEVDGAAAVGTEAAARRWSEPVSINPNLRFVWVDDGLPADFDYASAFHDKPDLVYQLYRSCFTMAAHIRQMLQPAGVDEAGAALPKVSFVLVGLFCDWAIDVAVDLSIPPVLFWTQSATVFSVYLHLPELISHGVFSQDAQFDSEEVVTCISGVPPLRRRDLPKYLHVNDAAAPYIQFIQAYLQRAKQCCRAILLNSFEELEGKAIRAMQQKLTAECGGVDDDDRRVPPAVYPVGPVLPAEGRPMDGGGDDDEKEEWLLRWLDGRAERSVVYVSFGTLCRPSPELVCKIKEGIRLSGKAYLWAIGGSSGGRLSEIRPPEDEDGVVVAWAPQRRVLAHASVGVFLTHCGWNSTVEAMMEGVVMVPLPMNADQTTNAKLVVDIWKIGVSVDGGVAMSSRDVAEALQKAAEVVGGRRMGRCEEWKAAAERAAGVHRYRHMDAFLGSLIVSPSNNNRVTFNEVE